MEKETKLRAGRPHDMREKKEQEAGKGEEEEEDPKVIAARILDSMDCKIEPLFENTQNLPEDVFVMIKFICPKEFHRKYAKNSKPILTEELPLDSANQKKLDQSVDLPEQEQKKEEDTEGLLKPKDVSSWDVKEFEKERSNTLKMKKYIKNSFEELEFNSIEVLDELMDLYAERKSLKIKQSEPTKFKNGQAFLDSNYSYLKEKYYYLEFEDILIMICSVLKTYAAFQMRLELGREETAVFLILYGSEEEYESMADISEYELQVKPYAATYEYYDRKLKTLKEKKAEKMKLNELKKETQGDDEGAFGYGQIDTLNVLSEDVKMTDKIKDSVLNNTPIQYEDIEPRDVLLWSPYTPYVKQQRKKGRSARMDLPSENKYRMYTTDDLYHNCPVNGHSAEDESNRTGSARLDKCSKFRNIDKIRLLFDSFDSLVKLIYLKKKGIIETTIIKRNYEAYGDKLHFCPIFQKCLNIFSQYNFKYLINLIRNYYGEVISFYFAWLEYYLQWLFFPAIFGLLVAIVIFINPFPEKEIGDTTFSAKDFFLLGYCVIIVIWAALFLVLWKQKEKWYSYIWGTESYSRNEPDSELFQPSYEKDFVFGVTIPFYEELKRNLKKAVSYLVLLIMIAATITIMYVIMYFKKKNLKEETDENYWYNMAVTAVSAAVNALQIKAFNLAYTYLAEIFNKWENYKKDYQRNSDLAVKLVIFDFVNCYCSLFYIGIYKPIAKEPCIGTCLGEIGTQLYTTFAINFGLDFVEVGLPFAMFKVREFFYKRSIQNKENIELKPHSVTHQMLCDEYTSTIYEYNEMLILFGYVCLFSVTAPLTPLIVLLLVWVEKLGDVFKIFFLERVQVTDQATGVDIYNSLMTVFMFIGMLTNSGIVLFSKESEIGKDLMYKLAVFVIVENVVLLMMYLINWNILPFWFSELNRYKELYSKKYISRKGKEPHLKLKKQCEKLERELGGEQPLEDSRNIPNPDRRRKREDHDLIDE
ncbi:MAG: anoctamin [archaeon]|nr:anoctamin [archaeon]